MTALAVGALLGTAQALAPLAILVALLALTAAATRSQLVEVAQRFPPVRLLLWLGVACHEVGHALAALATFTPVYRIEVRWDQGRVLHRSTGALQQSLIAAGPVVTSTLVAVACSRMLLGPGFVKLSAPFGAPMRQGLDGWLAAVFASFGDAVVWLATGPWWAHLGVLVLLAGLLSTAVPSAHDLRVSAPSMARVALVAVLAETVARGAAGTSLLPWLRPPLTTASAALGLSLFCSALSLALLACVTFVLRRLRRR